LRAAANRRSPARAELLPRRAIGSRQRQIKIAVWIDVFFEIKLACGVCQQIERELFALAIRLAVDTDLTGSSRAGLVE
jgi:hypothetical protein